MLKIKRVLVPVDFSPASLAAVAWAADVAESGGAAVDLIHVWQTKTYASGEVFVQLPSQRDEALAEFSLSRDGRQMEHLLEQLRKRGVRGVGRLESGNPVDVIVGLAHKEHYDLIVMGAHGRGLRGLLGNIAEGVSRRAPCPVVTLHAGDESAQVAVATA